MSTTPALSLLVYGGAVAAVYVLVRWFARPLYWLLQAAWRSAAGGAAIWALDRVAAGLGVHVALNPATALVVGVLGLPGLVALVALRA